MKTKTNFSGVITALATPFKKGQVDFASLKKLVMHQLDNSVDGFVVNGTTAESPTLTAEEVEKIFKFVRKIVGKNFPLLLGTGSNSTAETIKKTKLVAKLKADAALVVVPYYNKPPQRGLVAHYTAVAKSAPKTKIVLYNVPGRTHINMSADTIFELSKVKNIIGVKEASGQVDIVPALRAQTRKEFLLSSGDDATCLEFMLAGGEGVVSVISHVIPKQLVQMSSRARERDIKVRDDYKRYDKLNKLMGIEANPMPVKMALHLMGLFASPELRAPLVTLAPEHKKTLETELKNLGIC